MHTFQSKHVLGPCRGGCPPKWRGGTMQDLTQAASPQTFWKQLEPSCFPSSSSVIASHLVAKPESPISCVTHDPSSAFVGQCWLHSPMTSSGSLRQKRVGSGSLGPKPGPERAGETPAQTGHLATVTVARQSSTRGARTQSPLSRKFPRDRGGGLGLLFSHKGLWVITKTWPRGRDT